MPARRALRIPESRLTLGNRRSIAPSPTVVLRTSNPVPPSRRLKPGWSATTPEADPSTDVEARRAAPSGLAATARALLRHDPAGDLGVLELLVAGAIGATEPLRVHVAAGPRKPHDLHRWPSGTQATAFSSASSWYSRSVSRLSAA